MSRILAALAAIFMSACATTATARGDGPPVLDATRTLVLEGVIANGNALQLAEPMLKLAKDGTGDPIDLVISSPGGDVLTGFLFIGIMDAARATGTKLRCFVPTIAASMAFQLLVHCDERYALEHAFLLFHRVRVSLPSGAPLTAPAARQLAYDMERMDKRMFTELQATLGMATNIIRFHFERETLHVAADMAATTEGFIKVYPVIPGLIEAMLDTKLPHMPHTQDNKTNASRIMYIWQGAQR